MYFSGGTIKSGVSKIQQFFFIFEFGTSYVAVFCAEQEFVPEGSLAWSTGSRRPAVKG